MDGTKGQLLNELAPLIEYTIKAQVNRKFRMLIIGPPGSGRTSVARALAQRYGFVNLSTSDLVLDQVSRQTEVGAEIASYFKEGKLVPDEIIFGLLKNRLERADAKLHGYILEGFPKNMNQLSMLESLQMKLKPHLYIMLDIDDSLAHKRLERSIVDPITMKTYT